MEDTDVDRVLWNSWRALKSGGIVLTKVVIPNSERTAVLKCLNRININYLSLFPDFEGALGA